MSWQLWDPPAIIIPAPKPAEIQIQIQQQQQQQTAEQYFKQVYDKPWNTLKPDGRINIENNRSATVSPYSEHFRSQVEDGIWPLVETLYLKGYLPVSSCAGHRGTLWQEWDTLFVERSSPYVSVVVRRDLEPGVRVEFERLTTATTTITTRHTQANMRASATRIHAQTRTTTASEEYAALNWQLQRNYTAYSYINIHINPWKRFSIPHVVRTQRELLLIQQQAELFEALEPYTA